MGIEPTNKGLAVLVSNKSMYMISNDVNIDLMRLGTIMGPLHVLKSEHLP